MKVHEAFERYFHIMQASGRFQPQKLHDALEPAFAENGFREASGKRDNILIIRLDVLGDMILTSGLFREVRRNYPKAHITAVVGNAILPFLKTCPHCDEAFAFERWGFEDNPGRYLEQMEIFCEEHLRDRRYDLCILPQWGDDKRTTMMLAYMSGARERVGYSDAALKVYFKEMGGEDAAIKVDTSFETAFLSQTIISPREIVHEAARNFYLLESMGIRVQDDSTELWVEEKAADTAAEILLRELPEQCIPVVLGIGAGGDGRKYPAEKYLEAVKLIVECFDADIRFILLGGKAEEEDGRYLTENLPQGVVLNLVGKTTIPESLAIVSLSSLYLGNDSGLMHAAAAAQVPVIALYREAIDKSGIMPGLFSEYARFSPWKTRAVSLRPKHALGDCAKKMLVYGGCDEPFPHCITQITPAEIAVAFETIAGGAV